MKEARHAFETVTVQSPSRCRIIITYTTQKATSRLLLESYDIHLLVFDRRDAEARVTGEASRAIEHRLPSDGQPGAEARRRAIRGSSVRVGVPSRGGLGIEGSGLITSNYLSPQGVTMSQHFKN